MGFHYPNPPAVYDPGWTGRGRCRGPASGWPGTRAAGSAPTRRPAACTSSRP